MDKHHQVRIGRNSSPGLIFLKMLLTNANEASIIEKRVLDFIRLKGTDPESQSKTNCGLSSQETKRNKRTMYNSKNIMVMAIVVAAAIMNAEDVLT